MISFGAGGDLATCALGAAKGRAVAARNSRTFKANGRRLSDFRVRSRCEPIQFDLQAAHLLAQAALIGRLRPGGAASAANWPSRALRNLSARPSGESLRRPFGLAARCAASHLRVPVGPGPFVNRRGGARATRVSWRQLICRAAQDEIQRALASPNSRIIAYFGGAARLEVGAGKTRFAWREYGREKNPRRRAVVSVPTSAEDHTRFARRRRQLCLPRRPQRETERQENRSKRNGRQTRETLRRLPAVSWPSRERRSIGGDEVAATCLIENCSADWPAESRLQIIVRAIRWERLARNSAPQRIELPASSARRRLERRGRKTPLGCSAPCSCIQYSLSELCSGFELLWRFAKIFAPLRCVAQKQTNLWRGVRTNVSAKVNVEANVWECCRKLCAARKQPRNCFVCVRRLVCGLSLFAADADDKGSARSACKRRLSSQSGRRLSCRLAAAAAAASLSPRPVGGALTGMFSAQTCE